MRLAARSAVKRSPTFLSVRSCPAESTARRSSRSIRSIRACRCTASPLASMTRISTKLRMRGRVAEYLGTIHHEHYVTSADAAAVIQRLPTMFDEPFGDSSAIPTFLVSCFARQHVTVALSGDGGDELFAGYRRHREALALWNKLRRIPVSARRVGAAALGRVPLGVWTATDGLIGSSRRSPFSGRVAKGLKVGAGVRAFDDLYSSMLDQWAFEDKPVANAGGYRSGLPARSRVRCTGRGPNDLLRRGRLFA